MIRWKIVTAGLVPPAVLLAAFAYGRPSLGQEHAPARPAPHVQPFADRLGPAKGRAARPSVVPVPPYVDGCDHAYGTASQCVPWTLPKTVKDKCGWLKVHGLASLPVHARDRHHLDANGDAIACGPGDDR